MIFFHKICFGSKFCGHSIDFQPLSVDAAGKQLLPWESSSLPNHRREALDFKQLLILLGARDPKITRNLRIFFVAIFEVIFSVHPDN